MHKFFFKFVFYKFRSSIIYSRVLVTFDIRLYDDLKNCAIVAPLARLVAEIMEFVKLAWQC